MYQHSDLLDYTGQSDDHARRNLPGAVYADDCTTSAARAGHRRCVAHADSDNGCHLQWAAGLLVRRWRIGWLDGEWAGHHQPAKQHRCGAGWVAFTDGDAEQHQW